MPGKQNRRRLGTIPGTIPGAILGAILGTVPGQILVSASLFVLPSSSGWASGFYLQDQSARGTGRAYSGEAADVGPDSLWWNPASIAGITQSEIDSTMTGILVWSKATDAGSSIDRFGTISSVGGAHSSSGIVSNGVLPSSAAALRLNDQWAFGFALTSPFSFTTKYNDASFTRYAALTSRLQTIDIQPSIAWRPTAWLGLGGGPNIERTLASLSSALPNLTAAAGDGTETLRGTGVNAGYNLGLQLHFLDDHLVFGAAYRSRIHHTLAGSLDVAGLNGFLSGQNFQSDSGRANFNTPWAATFAVRYRITERLTVNAQAVRTGWSEFNAVNVTQPVAATFPENYRDVTSGAFGVDYEVSPRWIMRAGVQYDPTPTQLADRDPRVPDANRWLFSTGTSVHVTNHFTVDAAAMYVDAQTGRINRDASAYAGTPIDTPIQLDGDVTATGLILALGTRLTF